MLIHLFTLTNFYSILAVVAKAPRKNVAAGRTSVLSPSGGGGGGKRKSKGGGCHSLKVWPIPKGQKGLQCFLSESSSSRSEGAGSSDAGPSRIENEQLDKVEEGEATSSSLEDQRQEEDQEEDGSVVTGSSIPLLDDDIAQLNSDDSDED